MRATEDDLRAALRVHAQRMDEYRQGKLTADEFRRVRVSYGLYYELEHTSHLQRIKVPGGVLSAAQAEELADIADEHGRGRIHVTTRQNVQLHWVDLSKVMEIYARLDNVGITSRGAAGDTVRNVTGCCHAGIGPDELFDVRPYVSATDEHFLFHPLNLSLPRKFKVAFSSCAADCVQARVNDIGFFTHRRDGVDGFSVYVAGGLGAQPFLAYPLREFVPAEDTLIVVEAVLRLWNRSGERKNRKKARVKHLFQRLGAERFLAAVERECAAVEMEQGDALRAEMRAAVAGFTESAPSYPPSPLPEIGDSDCAGWLRSNVFQQKQAGYYAATMVLPLGEITGAQLRGAAKLASAFAAGELRLTVDQNLMMPWIPGAHVAAVYQELQGLGLSAAGALSITDVVSCPGADYCGLAVSRSMHVATSIREHLLAKNGSLAELGAFRIRVSGCPNSCGQHHTGDIGLTGLKVKGTDGQSHPHYSLLLGGRVGESTATIGHRVSGRFPEEDVPKVLAALAECYSRERQPGECFGELVQRLGMARLTEVARSAA